jgi:hypothetical protein
MRGQALVLSPQGEFAVEIAPGMGQLFDDFAEYGWFDLGGGREVDPDEIRAVGDSLRCFIDEATERYPAARADLEALGASVEYREYAMAHEIRAEALDDLDEWLSSNVFR